MFRRIDKPQADNVTVSIDGEPVRVPAGESVAVAVLLHRPGATRSTPVTGAPRAPLCLMGVCFECLMEIDGVANRRACQTRVVEGMRIRRQHGVGEG